MIQEEKELLLKDLSARLPYGVKVKLNGRRETTNTLTIDWLYTYSRHIEDIKPYLRPMSSMTEEEKKEQGFYCGYKPYDKISGESYLTEYDMPDYMDFLLKRHFDYRGLIPMGLALEAPEGMYQ